MHKEYRKDVRTHKCIANIKEKYDYDLTKASQKQLEKIVMEIYEALGVIGLCPPITDIANKLGFTVYSFPFGKEAEEEYKAVFGVGVEFSLNENSNFFLVEKDESIDKKRFFIAYLLSYYLLKIDDRVTEFFNLPVMESSIKNDIITRMALTLLMPEDKFLAYKELIKMSYETNSKILSENEFIQMAAQTFRVSPKMVKARMILLRK